MATIIWKGNVTDSHALTHELQLTIGLGLFDSIKLQKEWTTQFIEIIDLYKKKFPSNSDSELLKDCNLGDSHWRWDIKAKHLQSENYLWFTLQNNGSFECAMVVLHPELSRASSEQIHYVDYLAVAPLNRPTPVSTARFKGLGTLMLKEAGKYINHTLAYEEGFGLHSLPQALPYYHRIGMSDFGTDPSKENLHYLEMDKARAGAFYHE